MITKRSEAKSLLETYHALFEKIINKPVVITFNKHRFDGVIITGIQIAKTTGMKNAPDKRITDEGKNKSPLLFEITTKAGNLQFSFDDTKVSSLTNGVRLSIPQKVGNVLEVDLRME
jgi:hypothetical protein